MNKDTIFKTLFIVASVAMMVVRIYYQSKVFREKGKVEVKESPFSLIAGSVAALTTIVFGIEYIFFHGFFSFTYVLIYPDWLRWLGGLMLGGGIVLLGVSHHYLGKSFHSLVVSKEDHILVESGPYRWIRHPIYLAYFMSYAGGGLLSSNLILTIVPASLYAVLVYLRMGKEEQVMIDQFGRRYTEYMKRTGRLLPRIGRLV